MKQIKALKKLDNISYLWDNAIVKSLEYDLRNALNSNLFDEIFDEIWEMRVDFIYLE